MKMKNRFQSYPPSLKNILVLVMFIIAMGLQAQVNETPPPTLNPVIENLVNNMVYVEGSTFMMGATSEQDGYAKYREKQQIWKKTIIYFGL